MQVNVLVEIKVLFFEHSFSELEMFPMSLLKAVVVFLLSGGGLLCIQYIHR